MAMLVPQAWEGERDVHPSVRDFYRYHAALVEPWDGPAGLVFTDGDRVAAALDRNGLRPLRYAVCEDGIVVCASEVGAVRTAGHGTCPPAPARTRRDAAGRPARRPAAAGRRRAEASAGARQPYGEWARTYQRRVSPGQPVERRLGRPARPPGRRRLHQGGGDHRLAAHGERRQGAHLLDGRRHRAGRAVESPAHRLPLPQAALRAGHEPARSITCASGRS